MRLRYITVLVFAIGALVAACDGSATADTPSTTQPHAEGSDMNDTPEEGFTVQDGDTLDVHYVGTLDDGSQFDSSRDRGTPLTFTVGTGQVIGGFDAAVRGTKVGDIVTSRIEPADAYGEWSEANVVDVPFNPEQGDIKAGDEVFLTNGQPAIILEVTEEIVKLDTNHRLAGEALTFEIEVVAITRG